MRRVLAELGQLLAIEIACVVFGAGIGFVQGEIVARHGDKIEQVVFAGGAAMIGGVAASLVGPLLYYSNRQVTFVQFCYILTLASVAGGTAAWLLSMGVDSPGWLSMFVTPSVAIFAAAYLRASRDANPKS